MAMIVDLVFQLLQMTLVIAVAPLLTGVVRATKARLTRRRGPPLVQPYRDLVRLAALRPWGQRPAKALEAIGSRER